MYAERRLGEPGDRLHQADGIQRLVGVFKTVVEGHFPANRQYRISLSGGGRQPCDQVGDARA